MEQEIYKAFAEVDDIISHSDILIQEKIPNKFKQILKNKKDKKYNVQIDYNKNIAEQRLLPSTKKLIALIYRDYLCSVSEKQLLKENNEALLKEKSEKYDISKIFKDKQVVKYIEEEQTTALTLVKEKNVFQKIFEKLINLFKKN